MLKQRLQENLIPLSHHVSNRTKACFKKRPGVKTGLPIQSKKKLLIIQYSYIRILEYFDIQYNLPIYTTYILSKL